MRQRACPRAGLTHYVCLAKGSYGHTRNDTDALYARARLMLGVTTTRYQISGYI